MSATSAALLLFALGFALGYLTCAAKAYRAVLRIFRIERVLYFVPDETAAASKQVLAGLLLDTRQRGFLTVTCTGAQVRESIETMRGAGWRLATRDEALVRHGLRSTP